MRKQLRPILVLALFLLLGIFWGKTELVSTYLVEPVARILWLLYRTMRSVDQVVYWILLILAVLPMFLRMLPENKDFSTSPAYESSIQNQDRILYWQGLILAAEADEYDRLRLQRSLQALSRSLEDASLGEDPGEMVLPPWRTGFQKWVQRARRLLALPRPIRREKVYSASELEEQIDQILSSMEAQMEGTHD